MEGESREKSLREKLRVVSAGASGRNRV